MFYMQVHGAPVQAAAVPSDPGTMRKPSRASPKGQTGPVTAGLRTKLLARKNRRPAGPAPAAEGSIPRRNAAQVGFAG